MLALVSLPAQALSCASPAFNLLSGPYDVQTPGGMWLAFVLILTSFLAMARAQMQLYRCAADMASADVA